MAKSKSTNSPPPKIADWPWWLERSYIALWILIAAFLLRIYFDFLWGDYHRMLLDFMLCAILLLGYFLVRFFLIWRENRPRNVEQPPATICPTCGYDLRATPLRCPECGSDTPLKIWLDKHPLDWAIYEGDLKPRMRVPVDTPALTRHDREPSP